MQDDSRVAELDRLELALRRLFDAWEAQRLRVQRAEARVQEMQSALEGVRSGALDPMELGERVRQLEAENHRMRERLNSAEALVQRIQARLQFMEDER